MEKYNLLYVDDEPSNLRVFKDTYRRKYNVYTATSAKEGMMLMEEHHIDLILSDQRMPEMTGVELLRYSLEKFPKINRILITGYSDINAVEDAVNQARIFQYIQKPWSEKSLSGVIDDALRIYQLEKENAQQKIELQRAKEKAEESDMLKTEFLHNLSHEIRTPLNGIYGFAQILDSDTVTAEERKNYIRIIQNSSNQLIKIVSAILEFSKLITDQVTIETQEISLNDLFSELFYVFELKAEKKHIKFDLEPGLSNEECFIKIDRTKLYQILSNILDNAFKYTEDGFVVFGYKVRNDKIRIYIKDSGVGIHADNQRFIFERFSQEERYLSNKWGGLGLGLSIAQENAKLIDASISLTSKKGEGAVFYVDIPYLPASSSEQTITLDFKNATPRSSNKYKILIVEDEEVNLYFLDVLIKKIIASDTTILHAYNGKEALDVCKSNSDINVILMDIKMPIMDGYEATKKIKEIMPHIPIIAQTAYSTNEDRHKAETAGCDDFISKPINKFKLKKIFSLHLTSNFGNNK
ncbi:response regulator [Maribellus comscasis]|uniref:histidine kinase n=1 Tax=Maribellus comscasis TaxID=2681766 RepID=A0A6I6JUP2_9BACT|nr:response regulator [Maribellus comscasis]QGY46786.1 response regulator [Maribellus comscasis]